MNFQEIVSTLANLTTIILALFAIYDRLKKIKSKNKAPKKKKQKKK